MSSTSKVFTGWLDKQPDWRFTWDRRLFTLSNHVLSYKERENLPDKKSGKILYLEPKLQYERCFRVRMDNGEQWTLRADDDETYSQWVGNIGSLLTASEQLERDHNKNNPNHNNQQSDQGLFLTATVEKRSYWTHAWKSRFLRLNRHDGSLSYALSEGSPMKSKTNVLGADLVLSREDHTEVAFTTANEDNFHVRFASSDEAAMWVAAVQSLLSKTDGCRWSTFEVLNSSAPMLSLSNGIGGSASPAGEGGFNRIAHCTFVLPGTDHLFVFGGRSSKGFSTTEPAASATLSPIPPHAASAILCSSDVHHCRFSGDHVANTVHIAPHLEGANAKVRPLPREGCCSVGVKGSQWILYGGRTAGVSQYSSATSCGEGCDVSTAVSAPIDGSVLDDVWKIDFGVLSRRGDSRDGLASILQWQRLTDSEGSARYGGERTLPRLAFHAGVALSPTADKKNKLIASCAESSEEALILFSGGTGDGLHALSGCWLYNASTGAVKEAPPLDTPRAQHNMALIPSTREVIVLGGVTEIGQNSINALATPLISIRNAVNGKWRALDISFIPPTVNLPPLPYPSLVCVGEDSDAKTTFIFRGGAVQGKELPTIARLVIKSPSPNVPTSSTTSFGSIDVISSLGNTPTVPVGVPLIVFGAYLYTVGGEGIRRLLLSSIPTREGNLDLGDDGHNDRHDGDEYL